MKFKGLLLTVIVVLGLLFAVLNWQVLFAPTEVNLLLGAVQVPLGIMLLGLAVALSLIFFLAALWERAAQLRQVTQQERVIENLRAQLERKRSEELAALEESLVEQYMTLRQQMESDTGRVETNLREELSQLERRNEERLELLQERVVLVRNELAADIGEMEDRLEGALRGRQEEVG